MNTVATTLSSRLLILLAFAILAQPVATIAQATAPAPLPPSSQDAINKGIIAAKVPDYLLAISYFEEARKAAPQAPVIYLNMGLAESRIPGRELRAIAWLGAYLAAYPDAPNAVAVKEQIGVLEVKNRSNVSRLLNSLQVVAGQSSGADQSVTVSRVAELWAKAGDIETAAKTVSLIPHTSWTDDAWKAIAESHLKAGDHAGAQRAAIQILNADKKTGVEINIISSQIASGEKAGAREALAAMKKSTDLFSSWWSRIESLSAISALQIKIGDHAAAQSGFSDAKIIADKFSKASDKAKALTSIAEAQSKAGDIIGGENTLANVQMAVNLIQDAWERSQAEMGIAQLHVKNGDIVRAQLTAKRLENYHKALLAKAIIELQIRNGDFTGALKTVEPIEMDNKSQMQAEIAEAQIQAGDIKGASNTLAVAKRTAEAIQTTGKSYGLARVAEAQAKTGDLAGARVTLISAQKAADLIPSQKGHLTGDDFDRRAAQAHVIKTQGKLEVINPRITIWLDQLYDGGIGGSSGDCPLNTPPFLDLAGHLKSLPPSDNPMHVFYGIDDTAKLIIKARDIINQQLKTQIGR